MRKKLLIDLAINDLFHRPQVIGKLGSLPPQAATRNEIRTRAGKSTGCPSRVAGLKWICFAAWTAA